MMKDETRARWLIGLFIAICLLISFSFRVFLPYNSVFTSDWIKFSSNDAYYHMRIVDSLVHNFPHILSYPKLNISLNPASWPLWSPIWR